MNSAENSLTNTVRRQAMEFHENRSKQPFIGLTLIWQAVKQWRRQVQTRKVLQRMSDAQLRDVGLERDDVC